MIPWPRRGLSCCSPPDEGHSVQYMDPMHRLPVATSEYDEAVLQAASSAMRLAAFGDALSAKLTATVRQAVLEWEFAAGASEGISSYIQNAVPSEILASEAQSRNAVLKNSEAVLVPRGSSEAVKSNGHSGSKEVVGPACSSSSTNQEKQETTKAMVYSSDIQIQEQRPFDLAATSDSTLFGDAKSGRRRLVSIVDVKHVQTSSSSPNAFAIALKGSEHTGEITGDAIRVAEAVDLHKKFRDLDEEQTGFVSLEAFLERSKVIRELDGDQIDELGIAIVMVNKALGQIHKGMPQEVSLETFKVVMLASCSDLEAAVALSSVQLLLQIREQITKQGIRDKIGSTCKVSLGKAEDPGVISEQRPSRTEQYLEPCVTLAVLANALIIGISLDNAMDWGGWLVFEGIFCMFWVAEFGYKIKLWGVVEYFLGPDWAWNIFDFLLVVCAVLDTSISVVAMFNDMALIDISTLTVVRMIRLVRITRLVRLLRLKMFRELQLMVNGIVGGLKTLFWALVFLMVIVYALGVLMRQVVHGHRNTYDCSGQIEGTPGATCTRGEFELDKYGPVLFGNVFRSMFTVFTCFTDSCNSPTGTNLLWHLMDTHGPMVIVAYVGVFVFVTFGIFNLILAIFVENTLQYARVSDQRRTSRRNEERSRHARSLNELLVKLCSSGRESRTNPKSVQGLRKHFWNIHSLIKDEEAPDIEDHHLNLRVGRESFEEALEQDEVVQLLEDLDVSLTSRDHLFDILDADGNGYLAISELVDGIMRLRGPADKGDTISAVLMVRHLQKHIIKFEEAVLHNQASLKRVLEDPGGHISLLAEAAAGLDRSVVVGESWMAN